MTMLSILTFSVLIILVTRQEETILKDLGYLGKIVGMKGFTKLTAICLAIQLFAEMNMKVIHRVNTC